MKKFLTIPTGLSMATPAVMHQPTQTQTLPSEPQNCVYLREISTGKHAVRQVIALNETVRTRYSYYPTLGFGAFGSAKGLINK